MSDTSYFKKLRETLKHPIVLLPTLIITVIWIVLGILQSRFKESSALSWLKSYSFG